MQVLAIIDNFIQQIYDINFACMVPLSEAGKLALNWTKKQSVSGSQTAEHIETSTLEQTLENVVANMSNQVEYYITSNKLLNHFYADITKNELYSHFLEGHYNCDGPIPNSISCFWRCKWTNCSHVKF